MPQPKDDLSRSLVALEQDKTLMAVVELSSATWLVGGMVPGIKRVPLKKPAPDQEALLALLLRWRDEAIAAGHAITRLVIAFEAGRDGFWLARWLRSREVEAPPCHSAAGGKGTTLSSPFLIIDDDIRPASSDASRPPASPIRPEIAIEIAAVADFKTKAGDFIHALRLLDGVVNGRGP